MSRNCEANNVCVHSVELDFLNEKYRELLASNTVLREQLSHSIQDRMQDPINMQKYLKLCEELTKERNELKQQLAETEYEVTQVLSERGSVLKENQNLGDKNESLRKELDKILKQRDDYAKECESLRQMRNRSEFLHSNDDLFSSKEKMTFLSLEVANQEIEKLKKLLERVQSEKSKAFQESEIAKGRRDWAISEREKIVQERDSVRNLCDELRKERDTATSKLLAAIRDKDEAFKKIEQLNEKIEALNNAKKLADSQQLHKKQRNEVEEEIEVDIGSQMVVNADYGIALIYSSEESDYNGNSFYPKVSYVEPNSPFYGKLTANDCIQYINGVDCSTLSERMLFKQIRTSSPICKMILKRTKPILKGIYNVQLQLTNNNTNHGINFENGIYIANIENNSAAYYEPLLSVGDRVLQINEKSVEGIKSISELNQTVMNSGKSNEKLSLKIMKNGVVSEANYSSNNISSSNKGWSRMTNQSTQTDHGDLKRSIEMNNFLPIVPFIPPPPNVEQDVSVVNTSISSSSPGSSKSSSKFPKNMFQKFRDAISNNNKENQENNAIAMLDSVLDSQDSLDTAQEKSKKSKHKKNIAKSWPRAALTLHESTGKTHSGTVVFNKKKERPRLYLIPTDDQPSLPKELEKISAEQQKAVDTFFTPPQLQPMIMTHSNRNSNPTSKFMRTNPIPPRSATLMNQGGKSPIYMHTIYEPTTSGNKNFHANRLSLNLSNVPPKSHFSPNTFMPIKMSNSIESTPMLKSPLDHPKDESMDYTSQKLNRYLNNYSNASKYDNVSDGENLSSSGGVSQQDSLNNASTGTLPSHLRAVSSSSRTQGFNASPYRHLSPLNFPPHDMHSSPSHDHNLFNTSSLHNSQHSSVDYTYSSSSNKVRKQFSREEMSAFQPLSGSSGISGGGGGGGNYQESGTFPRKPKAYKMPPNQVGLPGFTSTGVERSKPIKISNNSLDYCSTPDRASPMPTFQIQIVKPGRNVNINKRNSMPSYGKGYMPNIGEKRRVDIEKSEKPLGINIRCRNNRGIFVSHVGENSIASQVGLQVGDQLLEFCGINMRSATYDLAAKFLRQCGNSITMLVQYNPEKYEELSTSDENVSRSDDSTPQNSPKASRSVISTDSAQSTSKRMSSVPPQDSTGTIKSHRNTLMSPVSQVKSSSVAPSSVSSQMQHMMAGNTSTLGKEQPRVVYIETRKNPNLGVSLLGGNAYGIFIHSVQKDSIADTISLRVGDQILEYNGTDLTRATAEYAAFELAKPADKVTALVQYNIHKFNLIKDKPGDSFYIRVGFDRNAESNESELSFCKDDVLYVDNTMFRGVSGQWRAWKLDEYGCRLQCGVIPSQMKVEEELRLNGDASESDTASNRRSSTSYRRSFFKRIKATRSSRDSKELASFSNTHLSLYLEPAVSDDSSVNYYARVERLDYLYRPVLVIGALSEMVVDKLISDFPEQFHRCIVNQMRCSKEEIEMRLNNNQIIEYRRRGSMFECVSLEAAKDNKESHCILDVNLSAVERLHRNQIYPVVLLLKFKSAKQIKEIKDSRYGSDKFSAKQAKEMYEHAVKLESEYRQYISVVIQGVNITHMSTQIKTAVDVEQKKILWVPSHS